MPEVVTKEIHIVLTDYKCGCDQGFMRPTGEITFSADLDGPREKFYTHKCTSCGVFYQLHDTYPKEEKKKIV